MEWGTPPASVISSGGGAPETSWKEADPFLEDTEKVWRRLGASCTTQSGLVGNKVNKKEGKAKGGEGEKEKKGREREREGGRKKREKTRKTRVDGIVGVPRSSRA